MKAAIDIEIFSCAGGMAEGFRRAGIEFDMAVDLAADHCDSYEKNLGHRPVQMDARDLLRMAELGWSLPIRLLVADPPCTPWSRAGKRKGTVDPRDMLRETAKIISILKPRAYLIGNVPGLEDSNNLSIVQEVIGGLSKFGYCVYDFATLDAADFGVPQHRVRPFWYGHRFGPCIRWPEPTHGDPSDHRRQASLPGVQALQPWVTCGQALGHLPPKELGRLIKLRQRKQHGLQHGSIAQRPARVVGTSNLSDGNVLIDATHVHAKNHPPSYVDEQAMTVRAGSAGGATRALTLETREESLAPTPRKGRKRDRDRIPQAYRTSSPDRPAATINTQIPRNGAGAGVQIAVVNLNERHAPATMDQPAPTLGAKMRGQSAQVLRIDDPQRHHHEDQPARAITTQTGDNGVLEIPRHALPQRVVHPDRPADTLQAREDRRGKGMTMSWPWNRPGTTVLADPRLPPPGRNAPKPGGYSSRSKPNAVLLSEKAASILQGFPEGWVFSGKTKKSRWSQIGQAMPPPLAHAVAGAVVEQLANTHGDEIAERFVPWCPAPQRQEPQVLQQLALTIAVTVPPQSVDPQSDLLEPMAQEGAAP